MTVIVELVPSRSRTADGKKMFDVVQVKPYDQSPKPHGRAGNHSRYKNQQPVVGQVGAHSEKAFQYSPNPSY